MPHGFVQGFEALVASDTPENREFVAQVIGDNLDLMFRYQQTGGTLLNLEGEANGCLPFPPDGTYPPPA